jgi:hypothetical protein
MVKLKSLLSDQNAFKELDSLIDSARQDGKRIDPSRIQAWEEFKTYCNSFLKL